MSAVVRRRSAAGDQVAAQKTHDGDCQITDGCSRRSKGLVREAVAIPGDHRNRQWLPQVPRARASFTRGAAKEWMPAAVSGSFRYHRGRHPPPECIVCLIAGAPFDRDQLNVK
jgi:hypothetical protein